MPRSRTTSRRARQRKGHAWDRAGIEDAPHFTSPWRGNAGQPLQCGVFGNATMPTVLSQSELPGLHLIHRGKVRDVYALSERELLIVATDRLSAFDVVLPDPIPGK